MATAIYPTEQAKSGIEPDIRSKRAAYRQSLEGNDHLGYGRFVNGYVDARFHMRSAAICLAELGSNPQDSVFQGILDREITAIHEKGLFDYATTSFEKAAKVSRECGYPANTNLSLLVLSPEDLQSVTDYYHNVWRPHTRN